MRHKVVLDTKKLLGALDDMTVGRSQRWWVQPNLRDQGLDANWDGTDGLPTGFGKAVRIAARPGEYYEASVEDLSAFEYAIAEKNSPAWATSVQAWIALLDSLGAPAEFGTVLTVLQQEMFHAGGERKAPRTLVPHASTVHNAKEVKALLETTQYASFWRD